MPQPDTANPHSWGDTMADSPPVIRLEDIATFHRDGAVLLRGVLDQAWVDLVAEGLDDC